MVISVDVQNLSAQDILIIDQLIGELVAHREGELKLVVKNSRLRFARPSPSLDFGRRIEIKTGPMMPMNSP